jgi:hypothetical protein
MYGSPKTVSVALGFCAIAEEARKYSADHNVTYFEALAFLMPPGSKNLENAFAVASAASMYRKDNGGSYLDAVKAVMKPGSKMLDLGAFVISSASIYRKQHGGTYHEAIKKVMNPGSKLLEVGPAVQSMVSTGVSEGLYTTFVEGLRKIDDVNRSHHINSATGITGMMSEAFRNKMECLYDLIVTSQSTPLERFSFIAGAVELVKRATKDGFQIKHINTKLCRLEVLVTQYGVVIKVSASANTYFVSSRNRTRSLTFPHCLDFQLMSLLAGTTSLSQAQCLWDVTQIIRERSME